MSDSENKQQELVTDPLANLDQWRVIDTGLRRAAENMAFNKALLQAHQQGIIPNTLRFLQFTPAALIGYHQSVKQEIRESYCRDFGIDIQRRITGGGAIYLDQTQLGWELYFSKNYLKTLGLPSADMQQISRIICESVAQSLQKLGVDAKYRPRNDIEVNGKKVSGTGGIFDGDSVLFQGSLLIEFDVAEMLKVLNIPAEKLNDKAIASARERVGNLADLLGSVPSMDVIKQNLINAFNQGLGLNLNQYSKLGEQELELFEQALEEIDTHDWVYQSDRPIDEAPSLLGLHRSEGGLLRANVIVDTLKQRIKQIWITGDVFVNPKRMIPDLESALRNSEIKNMESNVNAFFKTYDVDMLMLKPTDFVSLIHSALVKLE